MRLETGGMIDRETPVTFTFDGKSYQGFAGDTLASALLANGVKLLGRSFKYHRPRGVFTTGSAEPNALVTIGEGAQNDPNIRATMQEIFPGMVARSQNNWPSLRYDVLASMICCPHFWWQAFITRRLCGRSRSGQKYMNQ